MVRTPGVGKKPDHDHRGFSPQGQERKGKLMKHLVSFLALVILAGVMSTEYRVRSSEYRCPEFQKADKGADDLPRERKPVKLTEEALRIHREAIVIDGHNDLHWMLGEKADGSFKRLDL